MNRTPTIRFLLHAALIVLILIPASCAGRSADPVVDVTPLGDAVRFLAVALVLGAIITGVMGLWGKQ